MMTVEPKKDIDTKAGASGESASLPVNVDDTLGTAAKEKDSLGSEEQSEITSPVPERSGSRQAIDEASRADAAFSSEPKRVEEDVVDDDHDPEAKTVEEEEEGEGEEKESQQLHKGDDDKSRDTAKTQNDDTGKSADDIDAAAAAAAAARDEGSSDRDQNRTQTTATAAGAAAASNEWQGVNLLRSRSPRPQIHSDPFFLEDNSPPQESRRSSSRSPTAAARDRKKSSPTAATTTTTTTTSGRRSRSRGGSLSSSSPTASGRKQRRMRWRRKGEPSVVEQVQLDAEARMQNSHFPGTTIRQWCDPKRAPNSNAGYVVPNDDLCHERVRTVSFGSTPRFPEPPGTQKRTRARPQSSAGRKSPSERHHHRRPERRHSWALGFSGSGSTARDVGFSRTERTTPLLWAPPYLKGGLYSEKFVRASTSKAAPGADVKKSTIGGYMGQCKTRFHSQDPRSYLPWQDCGPGPSGHVPGFSTSPIGAAFSKTTAPRRVIDTSIMHGNESPGPASPNVDFEKLIKAEMTKPRVSIAHRFGRGYAKDQEERLRVRQRTNARSSSPPSQSSSSSSSSSSSGSLPRRRSPASSGRR